MSALKNEQLSILRSSNLARDVSGFLLDRKAQGFSPKTLKFYESELRLFLEYLKAQDVLETEAITPTHLRAYLLHLGERRNPGGLHCTYRAVKTFLRWYEAEYEPEDWTNPIRKVNAPKLTLEPLQPANIAHVKAMLDTCKRRTFAGDRDRAILLALLDSGLRASELLALNLGDLSLETGALVVHRGKGGKFRTAFLEPKAQRAMLDYLRHRQDLAHASPLWVTRGGDCLTYWGLRQILRRRAERAGVPAPSPRDFRRAFALIALRNGVDLISLQRLLGQSDLSVIRRYLAQTEGDLQAAHAKASPVDRML
jgi:site-specific recombinase XerD